MEGKHKVCIAVDMKTLLAIREAIRKGKYNNRSQAFEAAMKKDLEVKL